jgi:hypothetical protein
MSRRASFAVLFLVLVPQTVHAFDHHEHHHGSDGGGGCSGDSASAPVSTATPSPSIPTPSHKRVFVTSTTYSGALGGASGADAECAQRALQLGAPGVFRAWLSDGKTGAYDRIADAAPWYSTSDAIAFSTKTDLRGAPSSELLDEYGGHAESAGPWSGNDVNGAATGFDCGGWTISASDAIGTAGTAIALDATWGGGRALRSCALEAPLVCFEQ